MRAKPPYWHWRLDRWNALVAAGLAGLALVLSLRGGTTPPITTAPAPAVSAVVTPAGALGEATQPAAAIAPTLGFTGSQTALLTGKPSVATGTAAPGAKIELFDGDTLLGQTTADANGNWTLAVPPLAPGAHTLVVRATGSDGVSVEGVPLTVTVAPPAAAPTATALPVVPPGIEIPPEGLAITADTPGATLSGTAAPGTVVQIYEGDTLLGEATAGPDGKWQLSLPGLAAGPHTLVARATAPDGAVVESAPLQVEVGPGATVTPPSIEAPSADLALTADTPGAALSGTAAPGSVVQIYDGDTLLGETTAGPDGKLQFVLPGLTAGPHTLVARTTAPDGTVVEGAPLRIEVAPQAPSAAPPDVTTPPDGLALTADTPQTLSGTAAPGATVQIYDGDVLLGETTAGPDGKWEFVLPGLAAGPHTLIVRTTGPDGAVVEGAPVPVEVAPRSVGLADYPAPYLVTLGPNQTVTVPAAGFCLNYGLPFPGSALNPAAALPDAVRKGLAYAVQRGYTASNLAQTQLAVWYLAEGKRIPGRSYTIADEIIRFAEGGAPAPEQGVTAPTLWDAVQSGLVTAKVTGFAPSQPSATAYSGRGALIIQNLTGQPQAVVIPFGVRFSDALSSGVQDMAILPVAK